MPKSEQEVQMGGGPIQYDDPDIGLWSRSLALRVITWIVMIQVVTIAALYAAAKLSGFNSVFEMIDLLRTGLNI